MACPRCQTEESIGAKFCGGCGRRVELLSCQRCGTGNPPASRFCHECGRGLAGEHVIPPDDTHETALADDTEEVKDSAFWEAYADRTGLPAAGLIEVAPVPEVGRREARQEGRDRRHTPRRHAFREPDDPASAPVDYGRWRRQRDPQARLQEDHERRPVRIVLVAGTVLVMALLALFLSTRFRPAATGPERPESIAPSDGEALAGRPVLDPVPAPTPPARAFEQEIPARASQAPSSESGAGQLAPPTEPQRPTTTPGTSVERMATFLVERDGPEGALQTALAVATFYPASTDDFNYWHRVAAAIRASTAPNGESGQAVRR